MKQQLIGKQQHDELLLFFAGWGLDAHPFEHLQPLHEDFMICYDYRDLLFDTQQLLSYQKIRVLAWSLGVWAAAKVLPETALPITRSIAVNGTLSPIHDEKGIPCDIFQGTIDHLNERNLMKFQRRMCYTPAVYEDYLQRAPQRTLEDVKEELICLKDYIQEANHESAWKWDRAYISTHDFIFPCENQQQAWQGKTEIHTLQEGHYCPLLFNELISHDQ